MAETTTLRKTYSQAFVLDRGKLTRIISVLEQRLSDAGLPFQPLFKVKLRTGKELLLPDLQEILALDNSIKNPIVKLEVEISGGDSAERVLLRFDSDRHSNIAIVVAGERTKWASEVFAELEEQIERTFSTSWLHRYVLGGASSFVGNIVVLFGMMAVMVGIVGPTLFSTSDPARPHQPNSLLQRALSATSEQEKLQVIFDKAVNDLTIEVRRTARDTIDFSALLSWRALFIALPIALVTGALAYLLLVCYPWVVFAWGDREQDYAEVVTRRKMIWTVVVVAVLLGITTNLFVLALPPLK